MTSQDSFGDSDSAADSAADPAEEPDTDPDAEDGIWNEPDSEQASAEEAAVHVLEPETPR